MSHTPKQARTLWCPMVRIARREVAVEAAAIEKPTSVEHIHKRVEIVGGCNTDALGGFRIPASCRCIADQCAMWRFIDKPFANDGIDRSHMERRGFCGIAGRPEVAA